MKEYPTYLVVSRGVNATVHDDLDEAKDLVKFLTNPHRYMPIDKEDVHLYRIDSVTEIKVE